jgi:hypothetical protein
MVLHCKPLYLIVYAKRNNTRNQHKTESTAVTQGEEKMIHVCLSDKISTNFCSVGKFINRYYNGSSIMNT